MTDEIEKFKKYLLDEAKEAKTLRDNYRLSDDDLYDFYESRHTTFMEVYGAFIVAFGKEK